MVGGRRRKRRRMMPRREIPKATLEAQALASRPDASAWVSANAGSGKTHVLTQRVVHLLLDGVPASRILCLTFTKAAAANMSLRVFDTLARWTSLDDAALVEAIAATGARMLTSLVYELRRRGGGIGVAAMCAGGGMGSATVIEV